VDLVDSDRGVAYTDDVAYFHLRMFWGAFDTTYSTPEYTGTGIVSGGTSAASGSGVGVRRAVLVFNRTPPGTLTDDVADMHFDFLNLTAGVPDDTWTTADFVSCETAIVTWWFALQSHVHTSHSFREIRWYRVGTGVTPPNPAARVHGVLSAGTAGGVMVPPQNALTVTLRTARRKQWGRTYLPGLTTAAYSGSGAVDPALVDLLCTSTDTMLNSAASSDFHLGVLSGVAGSFFTCEQLQVDDVGDVIRHRRWRNATHKKILP
jgi:hypothetical protein